MSATHSPRYSRLYEALDLGLQAWRTTPVREKFIAAMDDLRQMEAAERGAFIPVPPPIPERVVLGANGAWWRYFEDMEGEGYYSMCPNSTDNDPVEVVATYELVKTGPGEDGQANRMVATEAPDDGGGGRQQETPHVAGASYSVIIDRNSYAGEAVKAKMTGRELRELAFPTISDEYDLFLIVPGHDDEHVADDRVIDVDAYGWGSLRLFTARKRINAG